MKMPDDISLRCSTIVFSGQSVLLVHRTMNGLDDWVLPGGTPQPGESMISCARRELREETGIAAEPSKVAFVLEAVDPGSHARTVDLVFGLEGPVYGQQPRATEAGMEPQFVPFARLRELDLRPPLAGHLPGFFHRGQRRYAPYLGNLWRPSRAVTRSARGQRAPSRAVSPWPAEG